MGKIFKVTSKKANDSILQETVAKAQKRITKKAKGKVNKAQAREALKAQKAAKSTNKKVERALSRQQRWTEERKQRKENLHKQLGVLLLSHIPHGFYEEQLEKFFSQFGKVTKVRLVRSTVSGRSKGHAFIVFRYKEVAQIAAETTNNYLMGKRILKAKVIPSDEVKPKWFYHSTPSDLKMTVSSKRREKFIKNMNKKLTPEEGKKRLNVLKKSLHRMTNKLNEEGINYKYDAL